MVCKVRPAPGAAATLPWTACAGASCGGGMALLAWVPGPVPIVRDSKAAVLAAMASAVAAGRGRVELASASQRGRQQVEPLPRLLKALPLGTAWAEANAAGMTWGPLLVWDPLHAVLGTCAMLCLDASWSAAAGQCASRMSATQHLNLTRPCEGPLCWDCAMCTSRCRLLGDCANPAASLERFCPDAGCADMLSLTLACRPLCSF